MANTYSQIYLQAVFAVKYRRAIIDIEWQAKLFSIIANLINESNCTTIIVNGVEDHVHCFFRIKPAISVSELMKSVKAKSSKYINDNQLTSQRFEWQEGFGAFSYSHTSIHAVYNYILNQQAHHKRQNFTDEYLELLETFRIEYDRKYIFQEMV
ncbi:MAG: IS200/IS605 family transposase [Chitinophagia bacterium]